MHVNQSVYFKGCATLNMHLLSLVSEWKFSHLIFFVTVHFLLLFLTLLYESDKKSSHKWMAFYIKNILLNGLAFYTCFVTFSLFAAAEKSQLYMYLILPLTEGNKSIFHFFIEIKIWIFTFSPKQGKYLNAFFSSMWKERIFDTSKILSNLLTMWIFKTKNTFIKIHCRSVKYKVLL